MRCIQLNRFTDLSVCMYAITISYEMLGLHNGDIDLILETLAACGENVTSANYNM